ncbi:type VI secretion system accessory protein TagJ [Zavarzinella formosa]|uniref:type VI secretion system accessory protein TagJ n=1 Tax=Zavarzinella formosa TaxID=360055 RepID=UPI00030F75D0|nr:type VI secretion system accessory protein TagJ [Zavarzinella formosa]
MDASELFRAGQLRAAIDAQIQRVKSSPADNGARLFLFDLLLFTGDYDRAAKHLQVLHYDQPQAIAAVECYRLALDAEKMRNEVFAGKDKPLFLGVAPDHAVGRLQALQLYAENKPAEGDDTLAKATDMTPQVNGSLNGETVVGLRDGDDLLGPILEVLVQDKYCWVLLEDVVRLETTSPKTPRDILWRPTRLTLRDHNETQVLLCGLYHGSFKNADESVMLGRVGDLVGEEGSPLRGIGGRLFLAGEQWSLFADWEEWTA